MFQYYVIWKYNSIFNPTPAWTMLEVSPAHSPKTVTIPNALIAFHENVVWQCHCRSRFGDCFLTCSLGWWAELQLPFSPGKEYTPLAPAATYIVKHCRNLNGCSYSEGMAAYLIIQLMRTTNDHADGPNIICAVCC